MVTWCHFLLSNYDSQLGSDSKIIHHALVWCLICSASQVRQEAQMSVKKLCSSSGGQELALSLLETMIEHVNTNVLQVRK